MELLRSLMFVPGHRPRMVQRALGLGEFAPSALDVAILDLEDGVPPDEKDRARAAIAAALRLRSNGDGPARYVRVNREAGARDADLAAVLRAGLDGIVAPKIDHPDEVARLARDLDEREDAAGIARGSIRLVPSIESARGLLEAHAIAARSELRETPSVRARRSCMSGSWRGRSRRATVSSRVRCSATAPRPDISTSAC